MLGSEFIVKVKNDIFNNLNIFSRRSTDVGTNVLAGTNLSVVGDLIEERLKGNIKFGEIPELWDGKASERICKILYDYLCSI